MEKKWVKMTSSFASASGSMPAGSNQLLPVKEADNFIRLGHAIDLKKPIEGKVKKATRATTKAKEKRG